MPAAKIVSRVFLVVCFFLLTTAVWRTTTTLFTVVTGTETVGHILRMDTGGEAMSTDALIEYYTADGEAKQFLTLISSELEVGGSVNMIYQPENKTPPYVESIWSWAYTMVLAVAGGMFLLFGMILRGEAKEQDAARAEKDQFNQSSMDAVRKPRPLWLNGTVVFVGLFGLFWVYVSFHSFREDFDLLKDGKHAQGTVQKIDAVRGIPTTDSDGNREERTDYYATITFSSDDGAVRSFRQSFRSDERLLYPVGSKVDVLQTPKLAKLAETVSIAANVIPLIVGLVLLGVAYMVWKYMGDMVVQSPRMTKLNGISTELASKRPKDAVEEIG